MKVFISWSGQKSKTVALKLREWIHDVLQTAEPWMSERDIEAGARWSPQVAGVLEQTKFGVICLTRDNAEAPWLLFETGALAKTLADTFVCPYLIDMEPTDIPAGPLTQFQAKRADEKGTLDLMSTINEAMGPGRLSDDQLKRTFEKWWHDLSATLSALPRDAAPPKHRQVDEMVKETLNIVRALSRQFAYESTQARLAEFSRRVGFETPSTPAPFAPSVRRYGFSGVDRSVGQPEIIPSTSWSQSPSSSASPSAEAPEDED